MVELKAHKTNGANGRAKIGGEAAGKLIADEHSISVPKFLWREKKGKCTEKSSRVRYCNCRESRESFLSMICIGTSELADIWPQRRRRKICSVFLDNSLAYWYQSQRNKMKHLWTSVLQVSKDQLQVKSYSRRTSIKYIGRKLERTRTSPAKCAHNPDTCMLLRNIAAENRRVFNVRKRDSFDRKR